MDRPLRRRFALLPAVMMPAALSVLVGGCDRSRDAAGVEVRDSPGVEVVVNGPGAVAAWRLDTVPVVRLGSAEGGGAHQLHRVAAAVRDGGSIVVADGGSGELRWFDTTGSHLATAGGAGEGPGEFRDLSWIGRTGDGGIVAWDRRLRRVSEFRNRAFAGDVRPPFPDDRAYPVVHGALPGMALLATPGAVYIPESRAGVQRPPMPVWAVRLDPAGLDTVGVFPGRAVDLRPARNSGWIRTEVPFGPATLVAARGGALVVGDNARYELRYLTPAGALTRVVRVERERRPVTQEDLRAELDRRLAAMPPVEEIRAGARASFEATPPPDRMPAFDRLLIDADGNVWVRRAAAPGSAVREWDVIGPDGALAASVAVPADFRVTDIGDGHVLGVRRDELGVEYVELRRLHRAAAP